MSVSVPSSSSFRYELGGWLAFITYSNLVDNKASACRKCIALKLQILGKSYTIGCWDENGRHRKSSLAKACTYGMFSMSVSTGRRSALLLQNFVDLVPRFLRLMARITQCSHDKTIQNFSCSIASGFNQLQGYVHGFLFITGELGIRAKKAVSRKDGGAVPSSICFLTGSHQVR